MRLALPALLLIGLALAGGASAQAIPCGVPYVVRPGDTLQRIAVRAYGPQASFNDLVPANRSVFRRGDPSLVEVGQTLTIPCRDGAEEAPASAAAPVPSPRAEPPVQPAAAPTVLLLANRSGSGVSHAVRAAVEASGLGPTGETVAPEGIVATLRGAPPGSVAAGLARPDCGPSAAGIDRACTALAWSVPVDEVVVSVLTLKAAGALRDWGALADRRVCRAESVGSLIASGLAAGITAGSAASCIAALRDGTADAAVVLASEADEAVMAGGAGLSPLVEQFALARLFTRHVVALAEDAAGVAALDRLDAMIAGMRADGRWSALLHDERAAN